MAGVLVDSNLLVLWVVGSVNPERIGTFKRTSNYLKSDFSLLKRVLANYQDLYTVPHILAEVSNLTDLKDSERLRARQWLLSMISVLAEVPVTSRQGAGDAVYLKLGLTDAVIKTAALKQGCAVLTDDHDLYHVLNHSGVESYNFNHFRELEYGT